MKSLRNIGIVTYLAAAAITFAAAGRALAAPFTPGNLVVVTVPPITPGPGGPCNNGAWPKPITLTEYTTAGGFVQSIPLPTAGPGNFGLANGASTTSPQLNFSDFDNQIVYIACSWVNTNPGDSCQVGSPSPVGYIRYNANTGVVDDAFSVATISGDDRGVVENACNVFAATSVPANGTYKVFNGISTQFITGNCRYERIFNNTMYLTSGTLSGPGVFTYDPTGGPSPTITHIITSTGANPQGFAVADVHTVYLTECFNPFTPNGTSTGLYKFSDLSGSFTNIGRLDSLAGETPVAQGMDAVTTVSGGNATIYVVGGGQGVGGNTIYKVGPDPLNNTVSATWKATATSSIVTGLAGARSINIVPAAITPPTFTITTAVAPSGSGTVTRDLPGPNYNQCATVKLTANASAGFNFTNWSGDASGSANPLTVITNANKNITANFTAAAGNSTLTLNFTGNGTVNVNPPNTSYTNPPVTSQVNSYVNGSNITLTATAASGWVFDHWLPSNSTNPVLSVNNIQSNTTVTVVFKQLFRVRTFATGNGSVSIDSPTPDGTDVSGNPLFRDGSILVLHAFPGTFPPISQPWTFVEWQDINVNQLSTANPYTTAAIIQNTDFTARFDETPVNATARAFTTGNLVVGQIKDFTSPGQAVLREYTTAGALVQPPVAEPNSGTPSGQINSATSAVGFQIAFDKANSGLLYTATNRVNGGTATGFLRTRFQSPAFTFDLSTGTLAFGVEGRGVAPNGANVYYGFDSGLHDYNVCTTNDVLIGSASDNVRMLRFAPNGDLYCSTAGTSASGDFTGGPGIYRIDTPLGTPVFTQVLPLPGASPLDFCFADATHMYVGFNSSSGNSLRNVHRYFFDGSNWNDASFGSDGIGSLIDAWGNGLDVKVVGTTATVYIMGSNGPTNSTIYAATDDLTDPTGTNWFGQTTTVVVPIVARGRALRLVPTSTACALPGDLNGDGKRNGLDIRQYITCFISAAGCTPTGGCNCADVLGTGVLDTNNLNAFVNLLIQ